jgi:hypothetical protein
MEGYSYSSKGLTFSIGEFCGLLKYKMAVDLEIDFTVIPPQSVKMFILKGNSSKEDLLYKFSTDQVHKIAIENPT